MFKSINVLILFVTVSHFVGTESARILAFIPFPSISHQVVYRSYFQELANRGHEITVVTTDPVYKNGSLPDNLKEIDVHDVSYKLWRDTVTPISETDEYHFGAQWKLLFDKFDIIIEKQVQIEEFQNILRKNKDHYDLLILESSIRPSLILSHIFEAPVIQVSPLGAVFSNNDVIGVPNHPLHYPSIFRQKIYNLTIWDKIIELYNDWIITFSYEEHKQMEDDMLRRIFGSNVPTVSELTNNVCMLFVNMHPLLGNNPAVPPSVVHVWGIYEKPKRLLPNDLQLYLNKSKVGVIYMSFGTNTDPSSLPREKIEAFLKVFSKLPYDILWKWNKDNLPGKSDNIKIEKWFPQPDLLKHPKIKLFITQGGLQSTDEAITAGVPLIGIPLRVDQWYNTEKYKYFKIGEQLDFETLDEDILRITINRVINDKSYQKNIIKLRDLFSDQRNTSLEQALWWTEYVIRHNGLHLRSPVANISNAEYFEFDLIPILLISVFVFFCSLYAILYELIRFVLKCLQDSNKRKN